VDDAMVAIEGDKPATLNLFQKRPIGTSNNQNQSKPALA
jgi:hypothetical protein